ncbi:hypothetical protein [Oryzihumus leptocrescens]|uniref:Uncharacterized protein n=1 Tax=Oryzihumus leptocrescens TaxID=297536 RepID=A0A542Z988_9MICO|nr:hypothetical protein [Oryzihumus leptocrescens]TQL56909.1 hypothetical protein FB474_3675 [Oryzihumus leptocrescens]
MKGNVAALPCDPAVWRNLCADGEDLARHARAHIESLLHASRLR